MKTIWIIEDNANFRNATLRGLRAMDKERIVDAFANCEDAITAIDTGAAPDVILMNIGLPGMDGIEGIGEIKNRLPDASILVLTVFEDDDKVFRAIKAGASGYLLKSDSIAKVAESVELAIDGSAPIHPRIASRVLKLFSDLVPKQKDYGLNDRERSVLSCLARSVPAL